MTTTNNGTQSRWWQLGRRKPQAGPDPLAAYRRVAVQLQYDLPRPNNPRTVLFAAPTASPLSTLASINLAACLADELGRKVLLIDACPRTADLTAQLECGKAEGFLDFLADPSLSLDKLVLPTSHEGLWFLPSGHGLDLAPTTALDAMQKLLMCAQEQYEFVVLSGGPVLTDTTTMFLASHVGCVLLSVIEHETASDDLHAAQEALEYCKPRKIGIVLTTPVRSNGWYPKSSKNGNILSIKPVENQ